VFLYAFLETAHISRIFHYNYTRYLIQAINHSAVEKLASHLQPGCLWSRGSEGRQHSRVARPVSAAIWIHCVEVRSVDPPHFLESLDHIGLVPLPSRWAAPVSLNILTGL
jgi:hypothetical protein